MRGLKKQERTQFVGSFAQAKNLIERQMKIGNHLKQVKKVKKDNKEKVAQIKRTKAEDQLAMPLKTKVYEAQMLFDESTQYS